MPDEKMTHYSPHCLETQEDTPTNGSAVQTGCSVRTTVEHCHCVGNEQWEHRTIPQLVRCQTPSGSNILVSTLLYKTTFNFLLTSLPFQSYSRSENILTAEATLLQVQYNNQHSSILHDIFHYTWSQECKLLQFYDPRPMKSQLTWWQSCKL